MAKSSYWKRIYLKIIKINGEPRTIALGFALGLFIGMSPFMGFHMVIALFLATLFKWNRVSSVIGVWISNPLTAPFIYGTTYLTGVRILNFFREKDISLRRNFNITSISSYIENASDILWALVIGGIAAGIVTAAAGYFISYFTIIEYRRDIKTRIIARREKRLKKKLEKEAQKQENNLNR
jgi:uncharacterized protein (DUF2062 family)